jgi:4'-phosphopantetheinyl transferase EntD
VIATILPAGVAAAERSRFACEEVPFAAEGAIVARAVAKRRVEFAAGRACAHQALAQLGAPSVPLTNTPRGDPRWPAGFVGSITHTESYAACAVAHAGQFAAIGIDAEPNAPLPDGVPLTSIARPEERTLLRRVQSELAGVAVGRLLFCAKEATFKAWYPLTRHELEFEQATVALDASSKRFTATLLVPQQRTQHPAPTSWHGRWLTQDGFIITAVVLPSTQTV